MSLGGLRFRHGFRLQHLVLCLSYLSCLLWHGNHITVWCGPPKTTWKSLLSRPAHGVNPHGNDAGLELANLRKRELLEILKGYDVASDGLTKLQLIEAINAARDARATDAAQKRPQVDLVTAEELQMSQRRIAEIAMEDWQNATTVGFDCKAGRRAEDGVDFDIIGPDGKLQHTVSFRHTWPPTCTCAAAQSWGSQKRCKHVCPGFASDRFFCCSELCRKSVESPRIITGGQLAWKNVMACQCLGDVCWEALAFYP